MASLNQEPTRTELVKGRWTPDEDEKLTQAIALHGANKWTSLASKAGLNRCGKSCRLRWMNYLRPDIKRGDFTEQEQDLIKRMHKLLGNRWALIAGRLPGRTDNEIKNYWHTRSCKKIHRKEKQSSSSGANWTTQSRTVDERPSVADDDQKVHVGMKQECLVSSTMGMGTSAAPVKKEVVNNPEDYSSTDIYNIFKADDFLNLLDEEPLCWEVPQIS